LVPIIVGIEIAIKVINTCITRRKKKGEFLENVDENSDKDVISTFEIRVV